MTARFAQVALPLPLAQPYSYRVPEALADRILPGARVVVPVRRRELIGIVAGLTDQPPPRQARDVLAAPDPDAALPASLLSLAQWVSGYYAAPIGLCLRSMLPAAMWGASKVVVTVTGGADVEQAEHSIGGLAGEILRHLARHGGQASATGLARGVRRPVWEAVDRLERAGLVGLRVEGPDTGGATARERIVTKTAEPSGLAEHAALFHRAPAQRAVFEALEELGGAVPLSHLTERLGLSPAAIRALARRGLVRLDDRTVERDPFGDDGPAAGSLTPTAAQRQAIDRITRLPGGGSALLFGVTGSGKTLVYLETVRRELAEGRGGIILVPEIALTPQTVSRVRAMFGDQVAVLHSALSEGERADQWRRVRRGESRVVVGARSAVFAPIASLGVIVLDEEHEASYKNGEAPRYHAREVARARARLEGARLVLGSATPSLEAIASVGPPPRMELLRLPERAGMQPLPPVELLDLKVEPRLPEAGSLPWSTRLDSLVETTLARDQQVLLLLNRRGFAAVLQCPSCGSVRSCPRCSISLTVHQAPPALRCHYCGHSQPVPRACASCGYEVQRMRGVGTQQLEGFLAERYPGARVARMDLDTTSTRWSHETILGRVERREVDILVGTQMIAKGLDFPNVTLVGVVDADTGLFLPDFRAAERTFQLLAQVSGRAGRGPAGGEVVIQTRCPGHYALRHAARHDTEAFWQEELEVRRDPPYPPHTTLANLLVSGRAEKAVAEQALRAGEWLQHLVSARGVQLDVLGPAPCPVTRIKDRWRWHVLLRGPASELGRVVRYSASRLPRTAGTRLVIDRDPVSLM